jgi:hypothetical protein
MEVLIMSLTFAVSLAAVLVAVIVAEGSWSLSAGTGHGVRRASDFTPAFVPSVSEAEVEAVFGSARS